jgi:hypothetical protein
VTAVIPFTDPTAVTLYRVLNLNLSL